METVLDCFGLQGGVEWQEGQKEDIGEGNEGRSEGGEAAAEADGEEGAEEEVKEGLVQQLTTDKTCGGLLLRDLPEGTGDKSR